ncbi:hypothetical protein FRC17_004487, partial [Serendipita sp. 399]
MFRYLQIPANHRTKYDAVESERCNLLEAIQKLSHPNDELNSLKMRYNHTINRQWELKSAMLNDPLVVLPCEIWEEIIIDVLEGGRGSETESNGSRYVDELLYLLNVSKWWCARLLETPRLWAKVVIDHKSEDELAKITA